jgi:hypothetical protein
MMRIAASSPIRGCAAASRRISASSRASRSRRLTLGLDRLGGVASLEPVAADGPGEERADTGRPLPHRVALRVAPVASTTPTLRTTRRCAEAVMARPTQPELITDTHAPNTRLVVEASGSPPNGLRAVNATTYSPKWKNQEKPGGVPGFLESVHMLPPSHNGENKSTRLRP